MHITGFYVSNFLGHRETNYNTLIATSTALDDGRFYITQRTDDFVSCIDNTDWIDEYYHFSLNVYYTDVA